MQDDRQIDTTAVEALIDNTLIFYPDTFDKVEAKRRLVEVYKRVFRDVHDAQEQIISELIAERAKKECAQEKRKLVGTFKRKLS